MTDLGDAWDRLHDGTPGGWHVGRPSQHDERREWVMYAFDPSERPTVGKRSREWTAVGATELDVVAELAGCLSETSAERWPK